MNTDIELEEEAGGVRSFAPLRRTTLAVLCGKYVVVRSGVIEFPKLCARSLTVAALKRE